MIATIETTAVDPQARVSVAAQHVYDAECALHAADEAHVPAWVAAAAQKLNDALAEHLAALAAAGAASNVN
jgi:hypothetical protein